MGKRIKVGIAEDHDLVRQGMVALLEDEPKLEVVFDVSNGAELLEVLELKKVDIVLLDLNMPVVDGHEALHSINLKYPEVKVIIVSMHFEKDFITQTITNGARGFLPKNCDFEKVVEAIEAVHANGFHFDENVSQALVFELLNRKTKPAEDSNVLTDREIEVIELVCQGNKNKEIAERLFLSTRTIEGHRQRISEKTNTRNVAELVIFAIEKGIYEIKQP